MRKIVETYASPHFHSVDLSRVFNASRQAPGGGACTAKAAELLGRFPAETGIFQGIPFAVGRPADQPDLLVLRDREVTVLLPAPVSCRHLVFLHAADFTDDLPGADGLYRPMRGIPRLAEVVAEYSLVYTDGARHAVPIRRRFAIGELAPPHFGEYCFEAAPHWKTFRVPTATEDILRGRMPATTWGDSQYRALSERMLGAPIFWLYALENPHPGKKLERIVLAPRDGVVFLLAIDLCDLESNPVRWESRRKLVVDLPDGEVVEADGEYERINLDLGAVISVSPVLDYGNDAWESGYDNQHPAVLSQAVLVEYTAHPDAVLYLGEGGKTQVPLSRVQDRYKGPRAEKKGFAAFQVAAPTRDVTLEVVEKGRGRPVAVKLHVHGEAGEYLPPEHRHRYPNPFWFEDYGPECVHGSHLCSYVEGRTRLTLPLGSVYVEVTKGFEIQPVRRRFPIDGRTDAIRIELEHVLPWREKGWVTADTHVHFLSPPTALLEGEAEGVNVVNVLATQLGEFLTNVGDFDGRTTLGSREVGGSGEYLVRVGTENRQHVLGHISLVGYEGEMILPLVAGGPDEAPMGDPVDALLSTWAEQCRRQGGLSIIPHFPLPRAEAAASIVLDRIDAVEMTSWEHLYRGIDPYSLSDWYRYLNCGYQVPAVGGTDKMSARMAVGTVRTYALVREQPFTYESWKEAVRQGETFVTHGPLLDLRVDGRHMGGRLDLPAGGGRVGIEWEVASVTMPVTRVELVFNGETREVRSLDPGPVAHAGSFSLKVDGSGWVALRVRGRYPDKPEIIAAHSSSIMIRVDGRPCFNHVDALSILEQIEGASAYVRSLGVRAEEALYKKLMMTLTSAHRRLHNLMHQNGHYHEHTPVDDHHGKSS